MTEKVMPKSFLGSVTFLMSSVLFPTRLIFSSILAGTCLCSSIWSTLFEVNSSQQTLNILGFELVIIISSLQVSRDDGEEATE